MKLPYLGGLTPQQFLQDYWQKKPLLIRQAFPGFGDCLTPDELAGLACEEDAQSRLVLERKGQWTLEQGPFEEERFSRLPKKGWSLLVQGVNHFLPEGAELLQQFNFIPSARLDDLMVSYAPDGGGVGPHFDSYDVFLLQGYGQRKWRVSEQDDMALVEGAPLRILKNFATSEEWLLEPGDMLYLPPRLAHWGIAVGPCMTWSVGFRAPSAQELGSQFLAHLQDKICLSGMYEDPDLHLQAHPAEISQQMITKVSDMLRGIRWDASDVVSFLGEYLTEPKSHVVFSGNRRMSSEKFAGQMAKHGVRLDLKTQILTHGGQVFINGESADISKKDFDELQQLADSRALPAATGITGTLLETLQQWHEAGYLHFDH